MMRSIFKTGMALVALTLIVSCKKDKDEPIKPTPVVTESEGEFVRLFASDLDAAQYYLVDPEEGTVETQVGEFAGGSLYSSPSGRFVAVINTADNFTSFFDSGVEEHGTHVHVKGTPKWALTKANGTTPIHYYGRGDNMLVFNDGAGTISHFKESTLHTQATAREINVGTPHHGAPALFSNGTIAVTEKDGSATGSLPERVKIIDMDGNTLFASTIQTGGIHGEAGNGDVVLFGSKDGILKVSSDGSQNLIQYPGSFGENWLGSIYYGAESEQFIGFKSNYGLYSIDPVSNSITTIEENDGLYSVSWDWEGHNLMVLYNDGTLKIMDGHDFETMVSKQLDVTFPSSGFTGRPTVLATEGFVYISDSFNANIKMYDKKTLSLVKEFTLPGNPARIALMGSQLHDEDGH